MKTEPIIMIADETLSVQAQLGEALGKRVSLVSAMNQEQLDYWLDEPARQPDILLLDQGFVGQHACASSPGTPNRPSGQVDPNQDFLEAARRDKTDKFYSP